MWTVSGKGCDAWVGSGQLRSYVRPVLSGLSCAGSEDIRQLRPLIIRGKANLTQPAGQLLSLPSGLAMAQLYNNGITDCLHTLTSAGRMEKPFVGLMSFKDCRWV